MSSRSRSHSPTRSRDKLRCIYFLDFNHKNHFCIQCILCLICFEFRANHQKNVTINIETVDAKNPNETEIDLDPDHHHIPHPLPPDHDQEIINIKRNTNPRNLRNPEKENVAHDLHPYHHHLPHPMIPILIHHTIQILIPQCHPIHPHQVTMIESVINTKPRKRGKNQNLNPNTNQKRERIKIKNIDINTKNLKNQRSVKIKIKKGNQNKPKKVVY